MLSVWPSLRQTACTSWKVLAGRNVGGGETFCPSSLGARWVLPLAGSLHISRGLCSCSLCDVEISGEQSSCSDLDDQGACNLCHVRLSACIMSVPPLGRFPWNFIQESYYNLSRKSKFCYNRTKLSHALHEDVSTFLLLLAASDCHKSVLFLSNGIRLLGKPRRYKHYANAPQRCYNTLPVFCIFHLALLSDGGFINITMEHWWNDNW